MQALSFEVARIGSDGPAVIKADGYVDTHTASELEQVLDAQIDAGVGVLLLDLAAVDYVSSAGWGVLISTVRRTRNLGGDIRLVGMQTEVRDVYELLEFPSILRAHANVEEALAAISTRAR